MITPEQKSQIARDNGAKSNGPITPEGKQRSSENAFAHGFRSSRTVIPGESQAAYDHLANQYFTLFDPNDAYEHDLIRHIIDCRWRLRRAQQLESTAYDFAQADTRHDADATYPNLEPIQYMYLGLARGADHTAAIERCINFEERFQRMGLRSFNALSKLRKGRPMPSPAQLAAAEDAIPSNFQPPATPVTPVEPPPATPIQTNEPTPPPIHPDWRDTFRRYAATLLPLTLLFLLLSVAPTLLAMIESPHPWRLDEIPVAFPRR